MQTKNFRVTVVQESDVVEICGALKVGFLHLGHTDFNKVCSSKNTNQTTRVKDLVFTIQQHLMVRKCTASNVFLSSMAAHLILYLTGITSG